MKSKITLISGLTILLIVILLLFLGTGCNREISKGSFQKDSALVSKEDSGSVKKNTFANENKWFKETIYYKEGKDTTINNYYTHPVKIIREAGFNKTNTVVYDSGWKKSFDSLATTFKTTTKNKKEQAFSFWHLIGVASVSISLSILLNKVRFSLKS
jgi:hypothetical protein